jgi:hypothetical protein
MLLETRNLTQTATMLMTKTLPKSLALPWVKGGYPYQKKRRRRKSYLSFCGNHPKPQQLWGNGRLILK